MNKPRRKLSALVRAGILLVLPAALVPPARGETVDFQVNGDLGVEISNDFSSSVIAVPYKLCWETDVRFYDFCAERWVWCTKKECRVLNALDDRTVVTYGDCDCIDGEGKFKECCLPSIGDVLELAEWNREYPEWEEIVENQADSTDQGLLNAAIHHVVTESTGKPSLSLSGPTGTYAGARSLEVSFERMESAGRPGDYLRLLPVRIDDLILAPPREGPGSIQCSLVVESPQLGVLFHSSVRWAGEGAPEIEGDIPAGAFSISNGFLRLVNYVQPSRKIEIPSVVNAIDVIVRYTFDREVKQPEETSCRFRRGDSNNDGKVDLADAIHNLSWLFLGGQLRGCPDAADSDDDGEITVTDCIRQLSWLFLGGEAPPAPGPVNCGPDPTPDRLPDSTGGQPSCM